MEFILSHNKVVAQGTGNALLLNGGSQVLREPDRQVGLPSGRFVGQNSDEVI